PAKTPAKLQANKPRRHRERHWLALLEERAADFHNGIAQDPDRANPRHQAIRQADAAFPASHLLQPWNLASENLFDPVAEAGKALFPQVGDFQPVAEQVVAVQLDERIEVEQRFDPRS